MSAFFHLFIFLSEKYEVQTYGVQTYGVQMYGVQTYGLQMYGHFLSTILIDPVVPFIFRTYNLK